MIRLKLKSENIKADQLAKYCQIAFLSFNSVQKRALAKGTIEVNIKDNLIEGSYRNYPILKTLLVEMCKRIMGRDENEVWDVSVMEKSTVIFKTDKPVLEPEPEIDSARAKSAQDSVSPEIEAEVQPEPEQKPEQPKFDPNQYTAMSVRAFKKLPPGTFLKKELLAILKDEKANLKRKTFIAYLNKLIAG